MSGENKWERRHTAEDERLSGRWRDEMEEEEVREKLWEGRGERCRRRGVVMVP